MTTNPPTPDFSGAVLLDKKNAGGPQIMLPEELAPRDANDQSRIEQTASMIYESFLLHGQGRFVQAVTPILVAIESNYRDLEALVHSALSRVEVLADVLEKASKGIPALETAMKEMIATSILEAFTPERYQAAKTRLGELLDAAGTCDDSHGEPCADYQCSSRQPEEAEEITQLVAYLQEVIDTIESKLDAETLAVYQDPDTTPAEHAARAGVRSYETVTPEGTTKPVDVPLKDQVDTADVHGEAPPLSAQDLNREEPTDGPHES